jgi:uncharacterized protein (TIGR02147 family)
MSTNNAFHVQYITEEYNRRSQANPHYSLRSFARDLDVAVSWLSDFLSGKKGLALPTAERFITTLGLSPSEAKLFLLSTKAYHSRSAKDREEALKELKALKKSDSYKMRPNDFVLTGTWYHQAILELTELEEFSHHEFEIAERLRLPLATIRRALQELQNAGMLEIKNGKMKALFPETESSADLPSAAIRKYHEQILQKSLKALHEQPLDQREYNSVTFAFDAGRVVEAKKALRKFHKQFTDEFYSNSKNKDSVYQLSLQFFRIDQKRKTS